MSHKISTNEITSPVLISTTNFTNLLHNENQNNHNNQINNRSSILSRKEKLNPPVVGLRQKSFSFLMSKQLVNKNVSLVNTATDSRTCSLSSSLSTSIIDQTSSSSKTFLILKQQQGSKQQRSSTSNLSFSSGRTNNNSGNFMKVKSSL